MALRDRSASDRAPGEGPMDPAVQRRRWVWFTVGVSGPMVYFVAAGFWGADGRPENGLSGWVEATATVAAFTAAGVAAIFAAGAFRLESEREQSWRQGQRSAQASQVCAWPLHLSHKLGPFDDETGTYPSLGITGMTVKVRNSSQLPVINARLIVSATQMAAGRVQQLDLGMRFIGLLEPEFAGTYEVSSEGTVDYAAWGPDVGPTTEFDLRVSLQFRDSAGVDWRRDRDGILKDLGNASDRVFHVPAERRGGRLATLLRRRYR